jgi:hypothetical protein
VLSVGIGGGLTGRPADLLIIDDPIKDRSRSRLRDLPAARVGLVDRRRLHPPRPRRPGRRHPHPLARGRPRRRLLAAEDGHLWRVLNIPAQADHDPAKGETDPLGRQPGEYMSPRAAAPWPQWAAIKVRSGARTWASLYQGRPSPPPGTSCSATGGSSTTGRMWIDRPDGSRWAPLADGANGMHDPVLGPRVQATSSSDWVVGQVWMSDGVQAWLLDQVRGRFSFVETMQPWSPCPPAGRRRC